MEDNKYIELVIPYSRKNLKEDNLPIIFFEDDDGKLYLHLILNKDWVETLKKMVEEGLK